MALNHDRMKQDFYKREAGNNNGPGREDYLKLEYGKINLFILSPEDPNIPHYYAYRVHFGFSSLDGSEKMFRCTYEGEGTTCPLCLAAKKLKDDGDTKGYNSIKAKTQFYYNVLTENNELKVLRAAPKQHSAIEAALLSFYDETRKDCTDMTDGRFLKLNRMKVDPWTTATALQSAPGFEKDVIDSVKESMYDLSHMVKARTPEELQQVLDGTYQGRGFGNKDKAEDSEAKEETSGVEYIKSAEPAKEEAGGSVKNSTLEDDIEKATVEKKEAKTEAPAEKKEEVKVEESTPATVSGSVDDIIAQIQARAKEQK